MERALAKVTHCDVEVEDHGIPFLSVNFEYEEGSSGQGLGVYTLDGAFVLRFMNAVGVSKLSDATGKSCWVTHDHSSVTVIEPLHKKGGVPFVIKEWQEWVEDRGGRYSAYEMRTGKTPAGARK